MKEADIEDIQQPALHSVDEWKIFIESEIKLEESKRNRYGITIWILLVCLATLSNKLITCLFQIQQTQQNTISLTTLTIDISAWLICIIVQAEDIINFYYINTNINERSITSKRGIGRLFLKAIVIIALCLAFFSEVEKIKSLHHNIILALMVIGFITLINKMLIQNVPIEPIYFMKKKSSSDKVCLFLGSHRNGIALFNGTIWILLAYFIVHYSYIPSTTCEIVTSSILINLIILLCLITLIISLSYFDQHFYENLKEEIFLSNLNPDEIKYEVEKNAIGQSTVNWLTTIYKSILETYKKITPEDSSENVNQYISKILQLSNGLTDFILYYQKRMSLIQGKYSIQYILKTLYIVCQCYTNSNISPSNKVIIDNYMAKVKSNVQTDINP